MVFDALKQGGKALLRFPAVWLVGLVSGGLGALILFLQLQDGGFYAERLGILQLVVLPFFVGGALQVIRDQKRGLRTLVEGGRRTYLRVLFSTVVILFAALITVLLLVISLALVGLGANVILLPSMLLGVLIPVAYFTFFYDAAIVYEDRRTLDAIRRSVEFVVLNGFRVFAFVLINLVVLGLVGFGTLVVWTAALAGNLQPLIDQNVTLAVPITTESLLSSLGLSGLVVTAILYLIAVTFTVSLLYSYKGYFFQKYAGTTPPVLQGEYDEKGRWYKY